MPKKEVKEEVKEVKKLNLSNEDMVKMFGSWREDMDVILAERQRKKDDLDHNIINLQNQYQQLRDDISREKREFEQWKSQELQKFENEKNKVMAELDAKHHKVDFGLQEHTKRMQDLERREVNVKNLEDIKHQLSLDRIEVENLLTKGKKLIEEGTTKLAVADDKLNKASELELRNKEENKRLKTLADEYNNKFDIYLKDLKLFESDKKNLEELRKVIEPKIAEFKKLEKDIENKKKENEDKIRELNETMSEEKSLLNELAGEKKMVEERKLGLNQREEEFKRKVLLNK